MTFIFRNRTIFWDILKWNRGQTKWDGGSNIFHNYWPIVFIHNKSWINGKINVSPYLSPSLLSYKPMTNLIFFWEKWLILSEWDKIFSLYIKKFY